MKKNRGFTLVELIVVLVILAILAAILVPALLGYIDKAKEKQDIYAAKACLDAAQAALAEEYGKGNGVDNKNVLGVKASTDQNVETVTGKYCDVRAEGTSVAAAVKNFTDEDPYIFIVALGNCNVPSVSQHDRYTVYYACYVKEEGSRPYYYYNGAWTVTNPTAKNNTKIIEKKDNIVTDVNSNMLKNNGKNTYIQYYVLCNKGNKRTGGNYTNDNGNIWYYLKENLQKKYDK